MKAAHSASADVRHESAEPAVGSKRPKWQTPWGRHSEWWVALDLSRNELKVLMALACRANERNEAYPHVRTIHNMTKIAPQNVARALRSLSTATETRPALIEKAPGRNDMRRRKARTYVIHFDPPATVTEISHSPKRGRSTHSPEDGLSDDSHRPQTLEPHSPLLSNLIVQNPTSHPELTPDLTKGDLIRPASSSSSGETADPWTGRFDDEDEDAGLTENQGSQTEETREQRIERGCTVERARAFATRVFEKAQQAGLWPAHCDPKPTVEADLAEARALLAYHSEELAWERASMFIANCLPGGIIREKKPTVRNISQNFERSWCGVIRNPRSDESSVDASTITQVLHELKVKRDKDGRSYLTITPGHIFEDERGYLSDEEVERRRQLDIEYYRAELERRGFNVGEERV